MFWVVLLLSPSALAGGGMDRLLEELRQAIEEGRATKAAKPAFLNKLETIVERAGGTLGKPMMLETFSDGEFDRNPTWTVVSGNFHVDASGALFSSQGVGDTTLPMEAGGMEPEEKSDSDVKMMMGIVGMLTRQTAPGGGSAKGRGVEKGTAIIHVPVAVDNAFQIRFTIRLDSTQGEAGLGLFMGEDVGSGYQLLLNADPNRNKTAELIRTNDQHQRQSIAVLPGNGLGDGFNHELLWKRTDTGHMTVSLDGHPLLQGRDLTISGSFDGLALINRNGEVAFDNIELSAVR
ncbi:MAG TPA: hypothetical protein DCS88_13025 [Alphaproteobacteria bacterium]|nr:hypothetical protein [Alphaproteobacteria bacterium]